MAQYNQVGTPATGSGSWEHGLFSGLTDFGLCFNIFFCGSCLYGRLYDAVKNNIANSMNCLCCCCGGIVFPCCLASMRGELRGKLGIAPNMLADVGAAFCCPWCTMCQLHMESRRAGVDPGLTMCSPSTQIGPGQTKMG